MPTPRFLKKFQKHAGDCSIQTARSKKSFFIYDKNQEKRVSGSVEEAFSVLHVLIYLEHAAFKPAFKTYAVKLHVKFLPGTVCNFMRDVFYF